MKPFDGPEFSLNIDFEQMNSAVGQGPLWYWSALNAPALSSVPDGYIPTVVIAHAAVELLNGKTLLVADESAPSYLDLVSALERLLSAAKASPRAPATALDNAIEHARQLLKRHEAAAPPRSYKVC